ncbi:unnamed protein product [Arabidopsis arenosa]|uniref:Uncharacterized protein n=1 Tax=Arabidopsis arenosa TaxID=38785 RepID=A0A8S2A144_ARAAE|nr:unnamed protein product [Arabidopsis arenosa]
MGIRPGRPSLSVGASWVCPVPQSDMIFGCELYSARSPNGRMALPLDLSSRVTRNVSDNLSIVIAWPLLLPRWPTFRQGSGIRWTSQRRDFIPASDRSFILVPQIRRALSRWVASRKTLLRTNGSHDRCTIDFARSILRPQTPESFELLRPFAYRLGRQVTLIRLRLRFVMPQQLQQALKYLAPKTLPRKPCFTFDPMCPENAMRSPLLDLAKRERAFFPLTFCLIRGAKKAGFAPATAILGKPKELAKARDAVSLLAFGEEKAEKKTSFTKVFVLPAPLLAKALLDEDKGGIPERERKEAADGVRGRFEDLARRSETSRSCSFFFWQPPLIHRTGAI